MHTNEILARDNKPHSVATLTERLDAATVKFRQRLSEMVDVTRKNQAVGSGRASLETLTAQLGIAGAEACRAAFAAVVEDRDERHSIIDAGDDALRFKEAVEKDWFTPFGIVTVERRTYGASDRPGRHVPLDALWGMTDRFLTPEVEEMVTFASALITPAEVEQLMVKALPSSPSSTAIKRAIRDVGDFLEHNVDEVEGRIERDSALSLEGDSLIVSWDGVMVPTRCGAGRTEWKEAGVGRLSIYDKATSIEERPEIRDTRYIARMPEEGMATLIERVAKSVCDVRASREFELFAIIGDGSKSIWKAASRKEFDGAVHILDFYHAAEHLAAASKAIFGEGERAKRWFEARRHDLRHFRGAIGNVLRALRRLSKRLHNRPDAHDVVRRVIKHFENNRRRMRYREFVDMGLPIGSGHVESAAKNIVNQRLKRSGMRWSLEGGQRVLNLRTLVKDGRWSAAWSAYRDSDRAAA